MAPGSPGTAAAGRCPASPVSPVSPRPWYKRSSSSTHRDSAGGFRDIFRSLEKRHKKAAEEEEWMPESGVPRGAASPASPPPDNASSSAHAASRFNIFSRLTEEWLGGEKRRSQVSMLANISELDREAAEIVQEQHARQAAVQARRDAEFYVHPENGAPDKGAPPAGGPENNFLKNGALKNGVAEDGLLKNGVVENAVVEDEHEDDPERPRKNSAKELISLFNAISSVPGGSAPAKQEASPSQDGRRRLFGAARSRTTDDDRLNGLSPKAARRTTTTPSFYETGPEVAALSERSFRVEAPLANADDDSDLVGTMISDCKTTAKAVCTTSAPSKVVSTGVSVTSPVASAALADARAPTKTVSSSPSGSKVPIAGIAVASTASVSKATTSGLSPSNPSKSSNSLMASDSKETTNTTITTSMAKASMKTTSTASAAAAVAAERVALDARTPSTATTAASTSPPKASANSSAAVVSKTSAAQPAAPAPQSTATATASATSVLLNGQSLWVCPRCTLENPRWRFTCDACSMWRPAERRPGAAREEEADAPPGPPAFLAEDKKAQEKALEKGKAPTTINWEAELKRYFKKDERAVDAAGPSRAASTSTAQDAKPTNAKPVQGTVSQATTATSSTASPDPKPIPVKSTASASTSSAASPKPASALVSAPGPAAQQTAVVKPQPSPTFIGGRLRQDEAVVQARSRLSKSKSEDMAGRVAGHLLGGGQAAAAASDVEELRKARLAFFRSSAFVDEDNDELTVALASMSTPMNAHAHAKDGGQLRDLLKGMKAGLPDGLPDGRNQGAGGAGAGVGTTGETRLEQRLEQRLEATKMVTKVEAKPRSSAQGVRPAKVSSSAQTSAQVIRKAEPQAEPPPPRPAPFAVVQDGVLYTSLRRGSRRLGSGTFKLIRESDFAGRASNAPLYMNVLPRPQRDAAKARDFRPWPDADAADSSPERRSTTESAEFATPSSSASCSSGGHSKAASRSGSRTDSPSSFSSSSERGDALPPVTRGSSAASVASGRGVASASLSTPMTSSRASSLETPPSSAGRLSRDASMDSVGSASTSASGPSRSLSVVSDCSEVDRLTEQLSAPQGIADFRAALHRAQGVDAAGVPDVNTLAVNRLLRRLEATIASGQHQEAARLAKDLAQLKISCCVTRQRKRQDTITVDMYVEDKVSHQGPIPLQVTPSMTVGQLAAKVAAEFQLPENVQRWILGKQLANDRASTLRDHNVTESGCPVFLYLVAPEPDAESDGGEGSSISGQSSDEALGAAPGEAPEPRRPPPPPADPTRRGGWYFNYEEDRYSFCEDSDEDLSEDGVTGPQLAVSATPTPAPRRVISPVPLSRTAASPVPEPATLRVISPEPAVRKVTSPEPLTRTATAPEPPNRRIKSPEPTAAVQRVTSPEPLARKVTSPTPVAGRGPTSSPTSSPTPARRRASGPGSVAAPPPQHPLVRPQTSGYRSQPLQTVLATATTNTPTNTTTATTPKVPASPPAARAARAAAAGAAAAKVTPPPAAPPAAAPPAATASTSYEKQPPGSWRCPRCTLLNSGVRPGCAACTAERPAATSAAALGQDGAEDAEEAQRRERERQYQLLVNLERQDLVPSVESFECSVCLTEQPAAAGAVLRECLHTFCRSCLIQTVQFSDDAEVKCPYRDKEYACDCAMQEREIKALVPAAMYERHLAKSMKQAEGKIQNAFHCKTPDCAGWCIFEDNVNEFRCPVCSATNCLTCQAIHSGANCAEYQARLQREALDGSNEDARRTQAMLEEMVARGEALSCPSCHVVLMKKWGCDWLRCSMCKTEICWVTRKPRWGPGGKGDTTGGCRCGVNGVKCHPKCNYCH